jgi:alpha-beta hydrolase superfamily lysophospholipase
MKSFLTFFIVIIGIYLLVCILVYFFQEKLMFFPQILEKDFAFQYENFGEYNIEMKDGKTLHALLFKAENSKGVVLYLHGNAGSLEAWGSVTDTFTILNYDVFIPDYRGYGKSEGYIGSEAELHEDIQIIYSHLKADYPENKIIVLGHSIGSGMAAKVAAANNPKLLILQAPYYSIPDLAKNTPPLNIFPRFLIKYKLRTGKFLNQVEAPVVILHGDQDEIIYYGSSLKLQQEFKPGDTLITLTGYGHNNFLNSRRYRKEIAEAMAKYE